MPLTKISKAKLATCDKRLIELVEEVSKLTDIYVLCGHRTQEEQKEAIEKGFSKVDWPKSKHNSMPSKAVDLAPMPLVWRDRDSFVRLAKIVLEKADDLDIKIRWGGDWNMNGDLQDDHFIDLPHFEIIGD